MKHYFILLFFAFIFFDQKGNAAQLKGTVLDSSNHPIAFATILIKGSTDGTSSSASGNFQLNLPRGKHVIICQMIGYEKQSFQIEIVDDKTVIHDFKLKQQALELKEVIVHSSDENQANRIIKKVIKKRSLHLNQVMEFQTSIYLKGVMRMSHLPSKILGQKINKNDLGLDSNGLGVLYLCEEIADYYAHGNEKEKTIIHSVHESGNPNGLGFATLPPVITFYKNRIDINENITPRGLISPIADNAFNYYNYQLKGRFEEDRNTIFKIEVTPKRLYEPCFKGYIYIVEDDWAIHSLSLIAQAKNGLEQIDTLKIEQQFIALQPDVWVIKSQLFYPVFNIMGISGYGNFITVYDNQKINEPLPDSIFHKKIISQYDQEATKKDSVYWNEERPIPLESDEISDFKNKENIRKKLENPAYKDSLRKANNKVTLSKLFFNNLYLSAKDNKFNTQISSLKNIVNFNTVEGLNISPNAYFSLKIDSFSKFNARLTTRYGFSNSQFNLIGCLNYIKFKPRFNSNYFLLGISGGKYVFQYAEKNWINPLFNTISTLFFKDNFLKIYQRQQLELYSTKNWGNGLSLSLKINYQKREPLENTTNYSWINDTSKHFTQNLPDALKLYNWQPHFAFKTSIKINYRTGTKYLQLPSNKFAITDDDKPNYTFSYEKGIPNVLNSSVDFDKWLFEIEKNWSLGKWGKLNLYLASGGFLTHKQVSIPDLNHVNGNQFWIINDYNNKFLLMPFYKYSNAEPVYFESHVTYNLLGLLSNKIPLLRKAHWNFVLSNNSYYINNQNYYTEAVFSIDNLGYKLFRFMKIDWVNAWDETGKNKQGFRLGINLRLLMNNDTQWN